METLFERIQNAKQPLLKFRKNGKTTACIYPNPYQGKAEVVRWFYSRNNSCQVFFSCSKEVSDQISETSWADVGYDFTLFVEHELMPYCVNNTDWQKCARYGIPYNVMLSKKKSAEVGNDFGCEGRVCYCEPFGAGDFTYGIADESEFVFD